MLLNQLFPHKVCINLDRRPERWQRMQAEFARHGVEDVRRFSAVDGSTVQLPANWKHTAGAYGCLLSHIAVVQEARELGHKSVLIFEDDAVFDPEFEIKFGSFVEQVPFDWDISTASLSSSPRRTSWKRAIWTSSSPATRMPC